jgi:hypothetical protein
VTLISVISTPLLLFGLNFSQFYDFLFNGSRLKSGGFSQFASALPENPLIIPPYGYEPFLANSFEFIFIGHPIM